MRTQSAPSDRETTTTILVGYTSQFWKEGVAKMRLDGLSGPVPHLRQTMRLDLMKGFEGFTGFTAAALM